MHIERHARRYNSDTEKLKMGFRSTQLKCRIDIPIPVISLKRCFCHEISIGEIALPSDVSNGLNDIADLPAVITIAVFKCGIVPGMKRVTVPRPGEIIP